MSYAIVKVPRAYPGSTNKQYRTAEGTWSPNYRAAKTYQLRNLAEYNLRSAALNLSVETDKIVEVRELTPDGRAY